MQRHEQTAQLALKECFPDAVIHHNNLWNEFNHQQVLPVMSRVLNSLNC